MTTHITPDTSTPELDPEQLRRQLDEAIAIRDRQLAALPAPQADDLVAVLHRESVERILGELRGARERVEHGTYGRCVSCARPIPSARLELRPWAATCTGCAPR